MYIKIPIHMCFFNVPYSIILPWFLYYSYAEELPIFRRVIYDTIFYILLPVCIVLDIISVPFHLMNIVIRSYLHIPYSEDYIYDVIFRFETSVDDEDVAERRTSLVEDIPPTDHDINRHLRIAEGLV